MAMETQLRPTEMINTPQTQTTQAIPSNANQTEPHGRVNDGDKVARRRTEDRRSAIKSFQLYYTDKRTFSGSLESNWYVYIDD